MGDEAPGREALKTKTRSREMSNKTRRIGRSCGHTASLSLPGNRGGDDLGTVNCADLCVA